MQVQEITAKLTASQKLLETKLNGAGDYLSREEVEDIFKRYSDIRRILQSENPSLFGDLPKHPAPPHDETRNGQPLTNTSRVRKLVHDISYCLDLLATVISANQSPTVTREGVFFSGQFFDALLKITDLITQAQKSIFIVDGYIDEDVLKLLTAKRAAVTANILTKDVPMAVSTLATAFNKQHGGLFIRTSQKFHDRFVVIDDRDFYHFGASIKNLGNQGFMFSRIEEPFVIQSLRDKFSNEWTKSTVIV